MNEIFHASQAEAKNGGTSSYTSTRFMDNISWGM